MPGARLERLVHGLGQRRGARDEQAHRRALLAREVRRAEQPAVVRRHAHHHGRARPARPARGRDRSAAGTPPRSRAASRSGARRTARARGRSAGRGAARRPAPNPHSSASETPLLIRFSVVEHRALGLAGGARRVEHRRGLSRTRREILIRRRRRDELGQRSAAALVERQHLGAAVGHVASGCGDDHARPGVTDEVLDLEVGVALVQRDVDDTGAHATEVQRHRQRRLRDLGHEAISRHQPPRPERAGDACAEVVDVAVREDRAVGEAQERLVESAPEPGAQAGVEVVEGGSTVPSRLRRARSPRRRDLTRAGMNAGPC